MVPLRLPRKARKVALQYLRSLFICRLWRSSERQTTFGCSGVFLLALSYLGHRFGGLDLELQEYHFQLRGGNSHQARPSSQGDGSKPPAGSRPISDTPWSGDHQGIKGGIGAGAADDRAHFA